jgi:hypothetical protein
VAKLHTLVLLAQRLAQGRRQHPSNAAFSQWLKDNGLGHLAHQARAALLKIAKLDPEAASAAIRLSRFTSPEQLWYRALSHMAVRKTLPVPVPVRKTAPEHERDR